MIPRPVISNDPQNNVILPTELHISRADFTIHPVSHQPKFTNRSLSSKIHKLKFIIQNSQK
jgi:hypothetical protein